MIMIKRKSKALLIFGCLCRNMFLYYFFLWCVLEANNDDNFDKSTAIVMLSITCRLLELIGSIVPTSSHTHAYTPLQSYI